MKLELTNSLIPFINIGMYDSLISPEYFLIDDDYDVDMDEYKEFIKETSKKYFNKFIEDLKKYPFLSVVTGDVIKIQSPREYNYETDELYFDINTSKDIQSIYKDFEDYLYESGKYESFVNFLKEKYKSYQGFVSMMPQNIGQIEEMMVEDPEKIFAAIVVFLMSTDGFGDYQEDFVNDVHENGGYLFFTNESKILSFKEFLNEKKSADKTEKPEPKFKIGDKVNYIPKISGLKPNTVFTISTCAYKTEDELSKAFGVEFKPSYVYSFKENSLQAIENDIKKASIKSSKINENLENNTKYLILSGEGDTNYNFLFCMEQDTLEDANRWFNIYKSNEFKNTYLYIYEAKKLREE